MSTTSLSSSEVSMQSLYEPILPHMEAVKESLSRIVPPDSELLCQTIQHAMSTSGKLLRPAVTVLVGLASGKVDEKLIETAAVTEMIHIATLLHDDVLDDADLRRGKTTVRRMWGNTVAVLSGDYLLAQSSLKLAYVGNIRLVATYSKVLSDLCDGEVEQIRTSYQLTGDWDSYFKKTICKTASLFSAGCESAGVLNHLMEPEIEALKQFGRNFGIAFQIMDDLLDYIGNESEMGKPVLEDLRNGLVNAPILLALEKLSDSGMEKRAFVQRIESLFQLNAANQGEGDIIGSDKTLVDAIQKQLEVTGVIEQTRQLAYRYAQDALTNIEFLSNSPAKQSLSGLVEYVVRRCR